MRAALVLAIAVACSPADVSDDTETADSGTGGGPTDSPVDSPEPTGDTATTSLVVDASGPILCLAPDVRTEEGPFEPTVKSPLPVPPARALHGGGVAVFDMDGDGRRDLLGVAYDRLVLWRQGPTRRFERTEIGPVPGAGPTTGLVTPLPLDLDDDGDLDLIVTGLGVRTTAWRQDPDGVWVEVTGDIGLDAVGAADVLGASAGDLDGDGDLDVVLTGYGALPITTDTGGAAPGDGAGTIVLRRDPSGFVVVADALAEPLRTGWATAALWLAGGGLAVAHDHGALEVPTGVWRWTDGAFATDTAIPRLAGDHTALALVRDTPDLVQLAVAGPSGLATWSTGDAAWTTPDAWASTPAEDGLAWGIFPGDVDHDGDAELLVTVGAFDGPRGLGLPELQADRLLRPTAQGWAEVGGLLGIADTTPHRGGLLVDLDGDGWLDVVRAGLDGSARIDWARCGEATWVEVALRQPAPNVHAVGARVTATAGDLVVTGRVLAGGQGFAAGAPPVVHLGLGDARRVDRLEVTWPDGRTDVLTGRLARQRLTLTRTTP